MNFKTYRIFILNTLFILGYQSVDADGKSHLSATAVCSEATPALGLLGLSLSYKMREDFAKCKFCKTSLKLFNSIYIKSKEEAGHCINYQFLWWQLLFVLNVLSCSGSTRIARHAVQRNNERENDFHAFF